MERSERVSKIEKEARAPREKKRYEPPAWEVEEVFEAQAMVTCSKATDFGTNGCGGPIQS